MTHPFSDVYAGGYDDLYRDKKYAAECDLLLAKAAAFSGAKIARILDLGCGTGSHALILAERGFEVSGLDRSEAMLAIARRKADMSAAKDKVSFALGDVQRLDPGPAAPFDLALMMFAVLGYQHSNDEVSATLAGVRRMLKPGGLFLFDCWFGPAVLRQQPGERVKVIERADGRLIRVARGELDILSHLCTVSYQLWSLPTGRPAELAEEAHVMRYFFPQELELLLGQAGFRLREIADFEAPEAKPTLESWNILCVAEAV